MKKSWKIYWPYFLLIPFVAAGIIGWFLLPAELAVQAGSGGTMPKLAGLLAPLALAALGSSQACFEGKRRAAGVVILIVAAVAEVLLFIWNL